MIHKIHIEPGSEIIKTITNYCKKNKIKNAAIVSIIGSLDKGRVMSSSKTDAKADIFKDFSEPFELSGMGEISEGNVHIHCTLGRVDGTIIMGHLEEGFVENWFVNIYVLPLEKKF